MDKLVTCILLITISIVACVLLYMYITMFIGASLSNGSRFGTVVPMGLSYFSSNHTLMIFIVSRLWLNGTCSILVENSSMYVVLHAVCNVTRLNDTMYRLSCGNVVLSSGRYFVSGSCSGHVMYLGCLNVR